MSNAKQHYKKVLKKAGLRGVYNMSPEAYAQRTKPTQARLNALRRFGVHAKNVLNPYGRMGTASDGKDEQSFRGEAMKRNRLKLAEKKRVALEAHELQLLARENADKAMKTLIEISGNKRAPEATRIAASTAILDRGYGKASQTSITANVTNGKARDITSDELDKRVNHALRRVEELTDRASEKGKSEKRPADLRKYN